MLIRHGDHRDTESLCALAIQVWLHTYAIEGVSSLIARYVLSRFTPNNFEALLREKLSAVFVAEIDQNLVGYATVTGSNLCPAPASAKVELATLYVQEHFMGKGIGHALLLCAEQWAHQRERSHLWLTTNSQNRRAIAFYTKHGYTKIGITHFELDTEKHENVVLVGRDA